MFFAQELKSRREMQPVYDKILVAVQTTQRYPTGRCSRPGILALLSKGEVWVLHLRERDGGVEAGQSDDR